MKETNVNIKLFNLQQEIGTISKDAKNPFYKSKYFDINSLIKQLQPYLKKHRLSLFQPTKFDAINNLSYVKTYFQCPDTKEKSEASELKLPELDDPQKILACVTYFRRATLTALLGLQAEDDDGNIASGKTVDKKWLNQNTPEYSKAIEFIKGGGSVEAIKSKYKVSVKEEANLNKVKTLA